MPKITATRPLLHVSAPTHSPQGTREGKGPLDDDKCRWEQENAAGQFLRVRGVGGSYTGVSSLSKAAQWGCGAWNLLPRITTPLPPVQYPNTITSLSLPWYRLSHHTSNQSQHLPFALKVLHNLALLIITLKTLSSYTPPIMLQPHRPLFCAPNTLRHSPRPRPPQSFCIGCSFCWECSSPLVLHRASSASYLGLCPMSHLPRAFLDDSIKVTFLAPPDPSTIHHPLSQHHVYWLHCIQPLLKLAICYLLPCLIVSLSLLPL